jgi:hypothetical protein
VNDYQERVQRIRFSGGSNCWFTAFTFFDEAARQFPILSSP